jgi:Rrf2 family protein
VAVVRISARADYALRACIQLARAEDFTSTSEAMAQEQGISQSFLQNILLEMRHAGYVGSTRARRGGYRLASPPGQITVADVVRAMDGPLVHVHGMDPDELRYPESTEDLATLWIAVRATVRGLLEGVTLQDLATGRLPALVSELAPGSHRPGGEPLREGQHGVDVVAADAQNVDRTGAGLRAVPPGEERADVQLHRRRGGDYLADAGDLRRAVELT